MGTIDERNPDPDAEADLLRRACTGAYVLVAVSDGDLDPREEARFFSALDQAGLDETEHRHLWKDQLAAALDAFQSTPQAAHEQALAAMRQAAALPGAAASVLALARIAAVADLALLPQENNALRLIAETMGLDPDLA